MRPAIESRLPSVRAAAGPPEARGLERDQVRLLVSSTNAHVHTEFRELPWYLEPGSLVVVNRSATLPARLPARAKFGAFVLHLSTRYARDVWLAEPRWSAARPGPLPLACGEWILVAGLQARALTPYPGQPRLWFVRFASDLEPIMARAGAPIRYEHVERPYPPIEAYQTIFADRPGSAEMPSAARPFTRRVVRQLRSRGIAIECVTLHAAVSSLEPGAGGDDAATVLPEPFEVPSRTADAVNLARRHGRPVIAVGTTVVRALESAWNGSRLRAAAGFTRVVIAPSRPAVVDALLTGFHEPEASHLRMLNAFAGSEVVDEAYAQAAREGYLWHEFGDSHLIKTTDVPPGELGRRQWRLSCD